MTPIEELQNRIKKLQAAMREKEIGGALLIQRADLFYFSGTGQNGHLFIPAEGEPTLIIKKSVTRAQQESSLDKIIPFSGWDALVDLIEKTVSPSSVLGLELDVLPANLYFRYREKLKNHRLVDISNIIRQIRAVKSDYEIGQMRETATISQSVFNYAKNIIREGMTEVELAGHLEFHARTLGHQGAVRMRGFNQELYFGHVLTGDNATTISFFDGPTGGSGLNPSFPQGAGANVIRENEPILIDFVSVLRGYMVDQTRIFCVGKPPLHLHEAHRQAVKIRDALAEMGKPGVKCSALYEKAKELVNEAGLSNHFMGYVERVNFIGHGVGIELDELPVIAPGFDLPLEEGMVFALEPKFIFPAEGTVGIEDTFAVGSDRLVRLTNFSADLQII